MKGIDLDKKAMKLEIKRSSDLDHLLDNRKYRRSKKLPTEKFCESF